MKLRDWLVVVGLALASMVLNVAMSFAWVFVYSLIEPGQTEAAYEAYAAEWAPVSSVVIGAPILFLSGWLAGRGREAKQAALMGLLVGALYVAIDAVMVLAFLPAGDVWLWIGLSWISKPVFGWLGGQAGARKAMV